MTGHRHGIVAGRFLLPHDGDRHVVDAARAGCERVTVVVLAGPADAIPVEVRRTWLEEIHPGVRVVSVPVDAFMSHDEPAVRSLASAAIGAAVGEPFDAVFGARHEPDWIARAHGAQHVFVDPPAGTDAFPSPAAVRRDPAACWQLLAPCVRAWLARRVCVVGAESSGTTTMARALADHYRTEWVPEYGREYTYRRIEREGESSPWRSDEFVEIARRQCELEEDAARRSGPVLICDTDALATAIWHERYMGCASPEVQRIADARRYDLYLLTDVVDVPFEADEIRDGEHLREWMTTRFREVLATRGTPVVELRGPHEQRLEVATRAVDALLGAGWQLTDLTAEHTALASPRM